MAGRTAETASGREGADAAHRRTGAAAPGSALGPDRQGLPVRHRRGASIAQAYKRRMGWSFPFASSYDSDFNYDFQAGHTKEAWDAGAVEYNFRVVDLRPP